MNIIIISVLLLGATGLVAALLLFVAAKRFNVHEDPRIAQVEELLPGANCGGCGASGCHAFAVACAEAESLDDLVCPSSGNEVMSKIASIVGLAAVVTVPKVAVLRCAGSCSLRPRVNEYDGVSSCAIENSFYAGETLCAYGCLGCGDCEKECPYDALHIDVESGLPVVDMAKCVGCGRCVKACPRSLFELTPNPGDRPIVWVACANRDKGGVALKECQVSCIGCTKCVKVCPSESVSVTDFLSHINGESCIGCGNCVDVCPRHSIIVKK